MGLFKRKDKHQEALNNQEKINKQETPDNQEAPKTQANITLYGAGSNLSELSEKIKSAFGNNAIEIISENAEQFQLKLKDDSLVRFSVLTEPNELGAQTVGMANFFSRAPLVSDQVKQACIHQIRMFTCIIGITFELNEDDNRTNFIVGTIHGLAKQLTAFVLYPSMQLYHPDGKLLLSIDGQTDFEEYYPIMCKEMVIPSGEENENDKKRKEKSFAILKEKGIPYIEHMGVAAYDASSIIPEKEAILRRAVAIFAACVKSEIYTCGRYEDPIATTKKVLGDLEGLYGVAGLLSTEEKAYVDNANPDMASHNKFGWRYECCAVLLWALSLVEMKEPTEICDASELGGIIWQNDMNSLLKKAVLRNREEILDMQDLVHRYHWACIEARIKKFRLPMLDEEIISEWHYALNWLAGVDGVTDWDEVPVRA